MKNILGRPTPTMQTELNNQAQLYSSIGLLEKAEDKYLQVIEIDRKSLGENHPNYARSLNNLGSLYFKMGYAIKAEEYLLLAKSIFEKNQLNEHYDYVSILSNLGKAYATSQDLEEAKNYFEAALELSKKLFGEDQSDFAFSLNTMGEFYLTHDNFEKADSLLSKARSIRERRLGEDHPDSGSSFKALAQLNIRKNKFDSVEYYLTKMVKNQKAQINSAFSFLSENGKAQFINSQIRPNINLIQSGGVFIDRSGYHDKLFELILLIKGKQLQTSKKTHEFVFKQKDSIALDTYNRLLSIKRRLAKQYNLPFNQREKVEELESQLEENEKVLARLSASFRKEQAASGITPEAMKTALKENEIVIEFTHFEYKNPYSTDSIIYAALLLNPIKDHVKFIPLFEEKSLDSLFVSTLERKADYVKQLYGTVDRGAVAINKPKQSLYELIWKPIEEELKGVKTIHFAPSGLLNRLNLSAISVEEEMTIGDIYNLVRYNSTRTLALNEDSVSFNNEVVLYGGIHYDIDSSEMAKANKNYLNQTIASSWAVSNVKKIDSTLRGGKLNYLRWTKKEIEAINELLGTNDFKTKMFSDHAATEESFLTIGQKDESPRILHIATHGFFFPDTDKSASNTNEPIFKSSDNPMIRSGLILAGGNHVWQGNPPIGKMEDGILTAYEISQMNLSDTELVVLSACETGLGDIVGSEGVYGLQRAFKIAGAKYLIMSLWQVPDQHTKDFMVTFYQNWLKEEMTIPDAFRKTQQEMKDRFYDPYLYAGFVLLE